LLWGALAELGVRRVTVYRVGIKEALARGEPVPGVTLGLLSHRQVSAYVALRPDTPESEVRRRLQDGAECVAAWRDGLLVATRWLRTGKAEIAYLGAAMSVSPGVWYAFDAFTLPEERRRGISGMVTAALVKRAQNLGATAVINAVVPENREGRGLARRSEPLGVLRSLRLGRWRIVASRLPPGYLGTPGPLGSTAQTT
jgi:GNAT superfamily N-acetyltransferase